MLNAREIGVEGRRPAGFELLAPQGSLKPARWWWPREGLSIPKMGATGLGYELARQFGLKVVEPRPALVPLVLGGDEAAWTELAGVAAEVVALQLVARPFQGEDAGDASGS